MDWSKRVFSISRSWLARARWNVLDLICIMGKESVPTYLFTDIDMTWAENLRAKLTEYGKRTTVTAILLKAIAIAQKAHPDSRTVIMPWGRTVTLNDICAGFTVERFVGTQPAVFFGEILQPDIKPIVRITEELKEYAQDDFPSVPQLEIQNKFNNMPWLFRRFVIWMGMQFPRIRLRYMSATFGLSTLGKFGIKMIVPPCVSTSTFGVGEVESRPVAIDGKVEIRPILTLALNFDHRVIDGAPAARFLQEVRRLMEGGLETYVQEELRALQRATFEKPEAAITT